MSAVKRVRRLAPWLFAGAVLCLVTTFGFITNPLPKAQAEGEPHTVTLRYDTGESSTGSLTFAAAAEEEDPNVASRQFAPGEEVVVDVHPAEGHYATEPKASYVGVVEDNGDTQKIGDVPIDITDDVLNGHLSFEMPEVDINVDVKFVEGEPPKVTYDPTKPLYEVEIDGAEHGSVSIDGIEEGVPLLFEEGKVVKLNFAPEDGFYASGVSIDIPYVPSIDKSSEDAQNSHVLFEGTPANGSVEFSMPAHDVIVTPSFASGSVKVLNEEEAAAVSSSEKEEIKEAFAVPDVELGPIESMQKMFGADIDTSGVDVAYQNLPIMLGAIDSNVFNSITDVSEYDKLMKYYSDVIPDELNVTLREPFVTTVYSTHTTDFDIAPLSMVEGVDSSVVYAALVNFVDADSEIIPVSIDLENLVAQLPTGSAKENYTLVVFFENKEGLAFKHEVDVPIVSEDGNFDDTIKVNSSDGDYVVPMPSVTDGEITVKTKSGEEVSPDYYAYSAENNELRLSDSQIALDDLVVEVGSVGSVEADSIAMASLGDSDTVTFYNGGLFSYGGYSTWYRMTIDPGNKNSKGHSTHVWCATPYKVGKSSGTYTGHVLGNETLRRAIWYADFDTTHLKELWVIPAIPDASLYEVQHIFASWAYGQAWDKGLGADQKAACEDMFPAISAQLNSLPAPPPTNCFQLYVSKNVADQDYIWANYIPLFKLYMKKNIDNSYRGLIQGDSFYSLDGTKYEVRQGGSVKGVFTFNASGQCSPEFIELEPGSYEVVEVAAGKGFLLDKNAIQVSSGGDDVNISANDIPNPPSEISKKINPLYQAVYNNDSNIKNNLSNVEVQIHVDGNQGSSTGVTAPNGDTNQYTKDLGQAVTRDGEIGADRFKLPVDPSTQRLHLWANNEKGKEKFGSGFNGWYCIEETSVPPYYLKPQDADGNPIYPRFQILQQPQKKHITIYNIPLIPVDIYKKTYDVKTPNGTEHAPYISGDFSGLEFRLWACTDQTGQGKQPQPTRSDGQGGTGLNGESVGAINQTQFAGAKLGDPNTAKGVKSENGVFKWVSGGLGTADTSSNLNALGESIKSTCSGDLTYYKMDASGHARVYLLPPGYEKDFNGWYCWEEVTPPKGYLIPHDKDCNIIYPMIDVTTSMIPKGVVDSTVLDETTDDYLQSKVVPEAAAAYKSDPHYTVNGAKFKIYVDKGQTESDVKTKVAFAGDIINCGDPDFNKPVKDDVGTIGTSPSEAKIFDVDNDTWVLHGEEAWSGFGGWYVLDEEVAPTNLLWPHDPKGNKVYPRFHVGRFTSAQNRIDLPILDIPITTIDIEKVYDKSYSFVAGDDAHYQANQAGAQFVIWADPNQGARNQTKKTINGVEITYTNSDPSTFRLGLADRETGSMIDTGGGGVTQVGQVPSGLDILTIGDDGKCPHIHLLPQYSPDSTSVGYDASSRGVPNWYKGSWSWPREGGKFNGYYILDEIKPPKGFLWPHDQSGTKLFIRFQMKSDVDYTANTVKVSVTDEPIIPFQMHKIYDKQYNQLVSDDPHYNLKQSGANFKIYMDQNQSDSASTADSGFWGSVAVSTPNRSFALENRDTGRLGPNAQVQTTDSEGWIGKNPHIHLLPAEAPDMEGTGFQAACGNNFQGWYVIEEQQDEGRPAGFVWPHDDNGNIIYPRFQVKRDQKTTLVYEEFYDEPIGRLIINKCMVGEYNELVSGGSDPHYQIPQSGAGFQIFADQTQAQSGGTVTAAVIGYWKNVDGSGIPISQPNRNFALEDGATGRMGRNAHTFKTNAQGVAGEDEHIHLLPSKFPTVKGLNDGLRDAYGGNWEGWYVIDEVERPVGFAWPHDSNGNRLYPRFQVERLQTRVITYDLYNEPIGRLKLHKIYDPQYENLVKYNGEDDPHYNHEQATEVVFHIFADHNQTGSASTSDSGFWKSVPTSEPEWNLPLKDRYTGELGTNKSQAQDLHTDAAGWLGEDPAENHVHLLPEDTPDYWNVGLQDGSHFDGGTFEGWYVIEEVTRPTGFLYPHDAHGNIVYPRFQIQRLATKALEYTFYDEPIGRLILQKTYMQDDQDKSKNYNTLVQADGKDEHYNTQQSDAGTSVKRTQGELDAANEVNKDIQDPSKAGDAVDTVRFHIFVDKVQKSNAETKASGLWDNIPASQPNKELALVNRDNGDLVDTTGGEKAQDQYTDKNGKLGENPHIHLLPEQSPDVFNDGIWEKCGSDGFQGWYVIDEVDRPDGFMWPHDAEGNKIYPRFQIRRLATEPLTWTMYDEPIGRLEVTKTYMSEHYDGLVKADGDDKHYNYKQANGVTSIEKDSPGHIDETSDLNDRVHGTGESDIVRFHIYADVSQAQTDDSKKGASGTWKDIPVSQPNYDLPLINRETGYLGNKAKGETTPEDQYTDAEGKLGYDPHIHLLPEQGVTEWSAHIWAAYEGKGGWQGWYVLDEVDSPDGFMWPHDANGQRIFPRFQVPRTAVKPIKVPVYDEPIGRFRLQKAQQEKYNTLTADDADHYNTKQSDAAFYIYADKVQKDTARTETSDGWTVATSAPNTNLALTNRDTGLLEAKTPQVQTTDAEGRLGYDPHIHLLPEQASTEWSQRIWDEYPDDGFQGWYVISEVRAPVGYMVPHTDSGEILYIRFQIKRDANNPYDYGPDGNSESTYPYYDEPFAKFELKKSAASEYANMTKDDTTYSQYANGDTTISAEDIAKDQQATFNIYVDENQGENGGTWGVDSGTEITTDVKNHDGKGWTANVGTPNKDLVLIDKANGHLAKYDEHRDVVKDGYLKADASGSVKDVHLIPGHAPDINTTTLPEGDRGVDTSLVSYYNQKNSNDKGTTDFNGWYVIDEVLRPDNYAWPHASDGSQIYPRFQAVRGGTVKVGYNDLGVTDEGVFYDEPAARVRLHKVVPTQYQNMVSDETNIGKGYYTKNGAGTKIRIYADVNQSDTPSDTMDLRDTGAEGEKKTIPLGQPKRDAALVDVNTGRIGVDKIWNPEDPKAEDASVITIGTDGWTEVFHMLPAETPANLFSKMNLDLESMRLPLDGTTFRGYYVIDEFEHVTGYLVPHTVAEDGSIVQAYPRFQVVRGEHGNELKTHALDVEFMEEVAPKIVLQKLHEDDYNEMIEGLNDDGSPREGDVKDSLYTLKDAEIQIYVDKFQSGNDVKEGKPILDPRTDEELLGAERIDPDHNTPLGTPDLTLGLIDEITGELGRANNAGDEGAEPNANNGIKVLKTDENGHLEFVLLPGQAPDNQFVEQDSGGEKGPSYGTPKFNLPKGFDGWYVLAEVKAPEGYVIPHDTYGNYVYPRFQVKRGYLSEGRDDIYLKFYNEPLLQLTTEKVTNDIYETVVKDDEGNLNPYYSLIGAKIRIFPDVDQETVLEERPNGDRDFRYGLKDDLGNWLNVLSEDGVTPDPELLNSLKIYTTEKMVTEDEQHREFVGFRAHIPCTNGAPAKYTQDTGKVFNAYYVIDEVEAPKGYLLPHTTSGIEPGMQLYPRFQVADSESRTDGRPWTFVEDPARVFFTVMKFDTTLYDKEGKPVLSPTLDPNTFTPVYQHLGVLEGCKFTLVDSNGRAWVGISDANGLVTFEDPETGKPYDIPLGNFTITEMESPDGYKIPLDQLTMQGELTDDDVWTSQRDLGDLYIHPDGVHFHGKDRAGNYDASLDSNMPLDVTQLYQEEAPNAFDFDLTKVMPKDYSDMRSYGDILEDETNYSEVEGNDRAVENMKPIPQVSFEIYQLQSEEDFPGKLAGTVITGTDGYASTRSYADCGHDNPSYTILDRNGNVLVAPDEEHRDNVPWLGDGIRQGETLTPEGVDGTLPYSRYGYRIIEVDNENVPKDLKLSAPMRILPENQINGMHLHWGYVHNNPTMRLQFNKVDEESGLIVPAAGFTFELYKADDENDHDWTEADKIEQTHYDSDEDTEGTRVSQWTTDESGTVQMDAPLVPGWYTIHEVAANISPYVLSADTNIEFDADRSKYDEFTILTADFVNKEAHGHLEFTKVDSETMPENGEGGEPLEGVVFQVRAREDIRRPDNTLVVAKGQFVPCRDEEGIITMTSGPDGVVRCCDPNDRHEGGCLPIDADGVSEFELVELRGSDGFTTQMVGSEEAGVYPFTVSYVDDKTPDVDSDLPKFIGDMPFKLKVTKGDTEDADAQLSDAYYMLWDEAEEMEAPQGVDSSHFAANVILQSGGSNVAVTPHTVGKGMAISEIPYPSYISIASQAANGDFYQLAENQQTAIKPATYQITYHPITLSADGSPQEGDVQVLQDVVITQDDVITVSLDEAGNLKTEAGSMADVPVTNLKPVDGHPNTYQAVLPRGEYDVYVSGILVAENAPLVVDGSNVTYFAGDGDVKVGRWVRALLPDDFWHQIRVTDDEGLLEFDRIGRWDEPSTYHFAEVDPPSGYTVDHNVYELRMNKNNKAEISEAVVVQGSDAQENMTEEEKAAAKAATMPADAEASVDQTIEIVSDSAEAEEGNTVTGSVEAVPLAAEADVTEGEDVLSEGEGENAEGENTETPEGEPSEGKNTENPETSENPEGAETPAEPAEGEVSGGESAEGDAEVQDSYIAVDKLPQNFSYLASKGSAKVDDDTVKLYITKRDLTTKEEVPGARLKLTDKDGNVVDEWVSGTEPHLIEELKPGVYYLEEVIPPRTHETAETIRIEVKDDGTIEKTEMFDEEIEIDAVIDKRQEIANPIADDTRSNGDGANKAKTQVNTDGTYDYSLDYKNLSNVYVDEFTVQDDLRMADKGLARLEGITTAQGAVDANMRMNVWYKTNKDDALIADDKAPAPDSDANATKDDQSEVFANPWLDASRADEMFDNSEALDFVGDDLRVIDYNGWHLWKADVSTVEAEELSVADLGLSEDEYVTAFRFEYGRVEPGFTTRNDRWNDLSQIKDAHDDVDDVLSTNAGTFEQDGATHDFAPAKVHMRVTSAYAGEALMENHARVDAYRNGDQLPQLSAHDEDTVVQSPQPGVPTIVGKLDKRQEIADPVAEATLANGDGKNEAATKVSEDGIYTYSLDFMNASSTWVDEFTVTDSLDAVKARYANLVSVRTPMAREDYDGLINVWYATNETMGVGTEVDSDANQTIDDGHVNEGAKRELDYRGYKLWKRDVSLNEPEDLLVADLGLGPEEYVTDVRFEFGRVEVGFTSREGEWDRSNLKAVHDDVNTVAETNGEGYAPAKLTCQVTDSYTEGKPLDNSAVLDLYRYLAGSVLANHDLDAVTQTPKTELLAEIPEAEVPLAQAQAYRVSSLLDTGVPSLITGGVVVGGATLATYLYKRYRERKDKEQ